MASPPQYFHILCVDDSPMVLQMLQTALTTSGYTVEIAPNGFSALMKVGKHPERFQLIITDLRMPGMDGISLIEQCRQGGYGGPFMVYAAAIPPDDRSRLRDLRVTQVLDKPAHLASILSTVKEAQSGF